MNFLTLNQVEAIHERTLQIHGGAAGLRDHGLLDAAVSVPQSTFGGAYLHADIATMAAAYLYHICRNHPFVDGNKRTALASALIFLMLNGYRLVADHDDVERLTFDCAGGVISKDAIANFFKSHIEVDGEGLPTEP